MARWGKAGQRLDDTAPGRAALGYGRHIKRRQREEAHEQWEHGLVKPFAITWALDSRGFDGPEVDRACGVEEPTVDEWETGETYPTWEQLEALARLTQYPLTFFTIDRKYRDAADTSSMRFHAPDWKPTPLVDRYPKHVWQKVVR